MIQINVNGSVVSVQETEALYCGAQNTHTCSFVFDRSWDSFLKSAVFRVNGRAITAVIDDNNSCVLPWELLVRDNIGSNIEVGVYGVSAESEILTSVWDLIGAVREGSEIGSDAREPSAGVYEQVMASVKKADDKIVSYSSEVQTLTQRAESAAAVAAADSKAAAESEKNAAAAAVMAESARDAVVEALNNLPEGDTLIINDLTTGGTSAALSAEMGKVLNRRPNPNLLYNWYFLNAVNQNGQSIYNDAAITVDGWKNRVAEMETEITSAGLSVRNTSESAAAFLSQAFEQALPAGVYTFSVLVTEVVGDVFIALYNSSGGYGKRVQITEPGVCSVTREIKATESYRTARIVLSVGASVSVTAIKVERGDTQTLAHQESSGNWVLNEIPDYRDELAKCQRYQLRVAYKDSANYYVNIGSGVANSAGTSIRLMIPTPVTMRANPTIKYLNGASISGFVVRSPGGDIKPTAVSSIVYDNSVMLLLTVSGATGNETYTVDFSPNGFLMDANL